MQPIEVWDAGSDSWADSLINERSAWVADHLGRAEMTTRVEFFLVDAPFAVAHRFAQDASGRPFMDPATGEPAVEKPATRLLDELPPARLRMCA